MSYDRDKEKKDSIRYEEKNNTTNTGNKNKNKNKGYKGKRPGNSGIPNKNDYTFYAASEQIAKDVASVPFNYMSGTKFPIEADAYKVSTEELSSITGGELPAVGVIRYVNSVGIADKRTDGINMAAVQLYTKVRQANSGAKNYEAADLMMYVLAMRDIYSGYFQAKRILGTVGLYNFYNHNLPDLIIQASGISATDLRENIAQYRGRLNIIARKINSFAVPKYFKAFARSAFIASYIFADSSSIRGQMYIFDRATRYEWSGTASSSGTSLVTSVNPSPLSNTTRTFDDLLDYLENQLDALFLDEDALTMSGDILKAFQDGELYKVAETPEGYTAEIVHDEDVLAQIENALFIVSDALTAENSGDQTQIRIQSFEDGNGNCTLDVTQDGQLIQFKPKYRTSLAEGSYTVALKTVALNSHKDNPDYKDVLEWTRLMTTTDDFSYQPEGGTTLGLERQINSCGLELPLELIIGRYDSANGRILFTRMCQRIGFNASNTQNQLQLLRTMYSISHFDWHPFVYAFEAENDVPKTLQIIGDIKVATTVTRKTLALINDAACYGAFYQG